MGTRHRHSGSRVGLIFPFIPGLRLPVPVFAPETGDGQGGGDPEAAAGGGQPQGEPPIGGADGAAVALYKPDGIADHLLGQDDKGTIDKLLTAYKGSREELSKRPSAPEKADAYTLEWGDKLKGVVDVAPDDEMTGLFRDIAHKAGFTQDHMNAIPAFFEAAVETGLIEPPHDTRAELRALAPANYPGSDEAKEAKGAERQSAATNWISQLSEKRGFDQDMKTELSLLTTTAAGVRVVENLIKQGLGGTVSTGGSGQEKALTKGELDARIADPRNDSMGEKYDPGFAKATDEAFKNFYGE